MDTQHEKLQTEPTVDEVIQIVHDNFTLRMPMQIHDMQFEMQDHRHHHDPSKDVDLIGLILANEDTVVRLSAGQESADQRQSLLLDSAALLIHDRGMIPQETRVTYINDCISKYNAIDAQKYPNEKDRRPIKDIDVQNRYQELFAEAEEQKQAAKKSGHWLLRKFVRRA